MSSDRESMGCKWQNWLRQVARSVHVGHGYLRWSDSEGSSGSRVIESDSSGKSFPQLGELQVKQTTTTTGQRYRRGVVSMLLPRLQGLGEV